jgi:hypothetical protein
VSVRGVDLHVVGVILMAAGTIGLMASLLFWNTWGGFGGYRRRRQVMIHDGPPTHSGERVFYEDEFA